MANDTYKYSYFVSYSYRDNDGYAGNGYANIKREDKISSFEELEKMAENIAEFNRFRKVIIINFKELEAAPNEDEVKVVRCKDCAFGRTDDEFGFVMCFCRNAPWDNKYVDYFTMSPLDYCSYGKKKEGAENGKDNPSA